MPTTARTAASTSRSKPISRPRPCAATAPRRIRITQTSFALMYWTVAQMIAHHTSNGCNLEIGDLIGSGTVSGPEKSSWGSLLELTARGREPIDAAERREARLHRGRRRDHLPRLLRQARLRRASASANAAPWCCRRVKARAIQPVCWMRIDQCPLPGSCIVAQVNSQPWL